MSDRSRNAIIRMTPLLALCGATVAAGYGFAHSKDEPVRCEIVAASSNGATVLQGLARADRAVYGSYDFRVTGGGAGGSTNIRQGGEVELAAGETATLGSVTLGGSGGAYDVRLEVTVGGVTVTCKERIARSI